MADDEKVGYRKPPKKHRFKKGQSGNPQGRPRKPKPDNPSEAEILKKISAETVSVNGREMTTLEYGLRVLQKKALSGNVPSMKILDEKLRKAGIDGGKPKRQGVLVVPGILDAKKWEERAGENQRQYRERRPPYGKPDRLDENE